MPDPLSTLAIVTVAVTGLSLLLARLIPDRYDRLAPERAPVRPRAQR